MSDGSGGAPQLDERHDPMLAMLKAMSRVRDGMWIRGAPTHVLAEFLAELEKDGWALAASPGAGELDRIEERLKRTVDEFYPLAEKRHNDAFKEALVAAMRGGRDD